MPWGKAKVLTISEAEQARKMRENGGKRPMDPRRIANLLGLSEAAVRRSLGMDTASCGQLKDRHSACPVMAMEPIPERVFQERERAESEVTLHVALLGDPPFSRSALGKRNEQSRQETENRKTGTQWQDHARAWHRPQRRGGPITAQNGGRLLARLAQGHPYREATRREG